MSVMFGLRFDFRNPAIAGTSMADRYQSAIEMVEWADARGCVTVTVSEHHGSDDGYLPSPLPMLGAMAARTSAVQFMVAAVVAPFHDPLRLAEDLLVLDNLSRGRVNVIVAGGYVASEFEMFGVPMEERAKRVTETVEVLKAAFAGGPFEHRGRTVHLTPAPHREGGPGLMLGGSSEPAARRAARLGVPYLPTKPDSWEFYCDELDRLGRPHPGPCTVPGVIRQVALAEDPEKGWEQMAPFFLHEMKAYGAWGEASTIGNPYEDVADVDELRETGQYAVLTPEEYVEELRAAPFPFAMLHPMCGGMPPELAWQSLHLFEERVVPAFADGPAAS